MTKANDMVIRLAKRSALLFSDGSLTVHAENWPMEKVYAEREEADKGARQSDRTKIVRVTVAIDEILLDPTNLSAVQEICSSCHQAKETIWAFCPYCGAQSTKLVAVR